MARFLNMLPVRTRAVMPKYASQWRDYLKIFSSVPDNVDWMVAGYPYSIYNNQIVDGLPTGIMLTIAGEPMLTIGGDFMEVI